MSSTEGWLKQGISSLRDSAAKVTAGTGEWVKTLGERMGADPAQGFRSQGLDPEIAKVPYEDRRVGQGAVETERRAAAGIGKTISDVAAQSGVGQGEALNPAIKQTLPGINDTIKAAQSDLAPARPAAGLRTPGLQGAWGAGPSQEAAALGGAPPGTPPTPPGNPPTPPGNPPTPPEVPPEAPKEPGKVSKGLRAGGSMLGKAARLVGRVAAPVAGMAGAYDAATNGISNTDDDLGIKMSGATKNATPMEEANRSFYGNAINVARRVGNAFDPSPLFGGKANAGNKIVGGIADIAQGNPLGTTQFPEDNPALRSQPAQPAAAQAPVDRSGPALNTNQGTQSPQELINGTAVPAPGQGAFQRRGGQAQGLRGTSFDGLGPMPANATPEQAAEWLRKTNVINQGRQAEAQANSARDAQTRQGGDELAPLRRLGALDTGGPQRSGVGGLAALGGFAALNRMKSNEASIGLRQQQIQATMALTAAEHARAQANTDREFANKVGQQNQEQLDKEHTARAEAQVGGDTSIFKTAGDREAAVKAAKSDIVSRFNYSVADSGKDTSKMSGPEKQQLYQAMDVQKSLEASRSGIMQSAADYLGTGTRVNSKNAYSYLPKSAEPATRPGESWIITMQNGNKIALKDLEGGQFQLLGPNVPVDADLHRMIQPLIDKYRRGLR